MMQRVLVLLLLPSVCGQSGGLRPDKYIQYPYRVFRVTWWQAQTICRTNHTDLVTIRNKDDFYKGSGWIGLYREDTNLPWKWSRGGEKANVTSWSSEPDSNDLCAYKEPDKSKWRGGQCNDAHSFMCFDEKLVLVKKNRTWEEALKYCRNMEALDKTKPVTFHQNHRFDLATLTTEDDHDFAREKAQAADTDEVWTGLRYLAGGWMWVGGETVQYEDIESCPKTKLCGTLVRNSTGLFGRRNCRRKLHFLCYRKN